MENNIKGDEEHKIKAIAHKNDSLKRLDISFEKHIAKEEYKTSDLLAYWFEDFSKYHDEEKDFDPATLKIFKRGDIVKVNLGFNIGNELGGLHYCVVMNKYDNKRSGTLNVIPLSSYKDKKYNPNTCVDLQSELYDLLLSKYDQKVNEIHNEMNNLHHIEKTPIYFEKLEILLKSIEYIQKIQQEILRMKSGSIALVHQMRVISKQRIFKTPILSNIRLSNASLDLLDGKVKTLFTK